MGGLSVHLKFWAVFMTIDGSGIQPVWVWARHWHVVTRSASELFSDVDNYV